MTNSKLKCALTASALIMAQLFTTPLSAQQVQPLALPGQVGWKVAFANFGPATAAGVTFSDADDKQYAHAIYAFGTIAAGKSLTSTVDISKDPTASSVAAVRFVLEGREAGNCGILPATGQVLAWGGSQVSFEDYKTFWRLTCTIKVAAGAKTGEMLIFPALSFRFGSVDPAAKGSINVSRVVLAEVQ